MNTAVASLVETPDEFQRRRYLNLVWGMSKEDMLKELIRVHGASAKMMGEAQATIDNLKAVIAEYEDRDGIKREPGQVS